MWLRKVFSVACQTIIKENVSIVSKPTPLSCCCRCINTTEKKSKQDRDGNSYAEMQRRRRLEAEHTVLVQHTNRLGSLVKLCQSHGVIRHVFSYKKNDRHYALVEYRDKTSVDQLIANTQHFPNEKRIPVQSRFIFFRKSGKLKSSDDHHDSRVTVDRPKELVDADLQAAQSLSDQMMVIYKKLRITEIETRLRFFVCSSLEGALRGLLHQSIITPFGSSVNGFGRFDCDLDMVLELESEDPKEGNMSEGCTYFMSKIRLENERQHTQQCLDTVAGILRHFMPHFQYVRRILNARVPIVKFRHAGCEVECDLCLSNRSALYMSELLYTFGQLDPRVHPLVFTIRHWARANQITHSGPGPWISNFTLSLLVMFHLQSVGVVPSIYTLRSLAGPNERKSIEDIDCSFTTDVKRVAPSKNKQSLGELLMSFLEFYGKFDFSTRAISLVSGKTFAKPENTPLYLENPIETELNVSKNVMDTNLANFQQGCREALEQLGSCGGCSLQQPWGVMSVLKTANVAEEETKLNTQIRGIFDDVSEEDEAAEEDGEDKEQRSEHRH